jgi:site-specific DNA recombinase
VSTEEQAKHGLGLTVQLNHGREVIERNGWATVGEFVDDGVSGTVLHRPALDRLLAHCRAGEVDVVVVYDLSRLGRKDSVSATIYDELDEYEVAICSDGQLYSTSDESILHRGVTGTVAAYDRRKSVRRMAKALHERANQGRYTGGMTPYGVTVRYPESEGPGKPKAQFVVDEVEAECIRTAWQLVVVEHKTVWEAATELNALRLRPRKSERWTPRNLRRVLLSPSLKGEVVYAKPPQLPSAKARKWHQATGRYGEPVPMTVPAVLSEEEWLALQTALARSTTATPVKSKAYLLSGRGQPRLLTPCQGHMHGRFRNDRQLRQYACGNCALLDPADRCDCPKVNADEIEGLVTTSLLGMLMNPDLLDQAVHRWLEPEPATLLPDQPEDLDRQIAGLERSLASAYEIGLRGGLDADALATATANIRADLEALRERKRRSESDRVQRAERERLVAELPSYAERAWSWGPDEWRRFIINMDVRVTIVRWVPSDWRGLLGEPYPYPYMIDIVGLLAPLGERTDSSALAPVTVPPAAIAP